MHVYVRGIIVERQKSLKCDSSRPDLAEQIRVHVCVGVERSELNQEEQEQFSNNNNNNNNSKSLSKCQCPVCACLPSVLCSVCPCFELAERIILKQRIPERKCNFGLASKSIVRFEKRENESCDWLNRSVDNDQLIDRLHLQQELSLAFAAFIFAHFGPTASVQLIN
ncbi:Myotubularin-related protein [Trichinella pseudospiralis]